MTLKGLPKIHEHDGEPAQGFGLFHDGRMVVYYVYSSDIGDGLEDADVHPADTPQVRELAAKMAVNYRSCVCANTLIGFKSGSRHAPWTWQFGCRPTPLRVCDWMGQPIPKRRIQTYVCALKTKDGQRLPLPMFLCKLKE